MYVYVCVCVSVCLSLFADLPPPLPLSLRYCYTLLFSLRWTERLQLSLLSSAARKYTVMDDDISAFRILCSFGSQLSVLESLGSSTSMRAVSPSLINHGCATRAE